MTQARPMRRAVHFARIVVPGGVALALLLAAAAAAQPILEVSRSGTRFSVDAAGVSVSTVLVALGREAGFRVQDSRPDATRPEVDIALVDATLEQALTRLLEHHNHLIVYRTGVTAQKAVPGSIERVVLLGPRNEQPSVPLARSVATGVASSPLAGPVPPAPPPGAARTAGTVRSLGATRGRSAAGMPEAGAVEAAPGESPIAAPEEALPPDPAEDEGLAEEAMAEVVTAQEMQGEQDGGFLADVGPGDLGGIDGGEEPEALPEPEIYFPVGEGTLPDR